MDTLYDRMNDHQREFGFELLGKLANELGLDLDHTVEMIEKVNNIRDFYTWVNADLFITEYKYAKDKETRAFYDAHRVEK